MGELIKFERHYEIWYRDLEYHFCEIMRYDFYLSPIRTPRLVEHDVLSGLSESRLGRVPEMLVVVEVGG